MTSPSPATAQQQPGRAFLLDRLPALRAIEQAQRRVVTREQLAQLGVCCHHVQAQIDGERWAEVVPGVISLHRGPLLEPDRHWVAVLAGGLDASLASWTALEVRGLRGWERPLVHIAVPRGRHVPRMPGVVVHESRRHSSVDVHPSPGAPAHSVERAAIDAAAWSRSPRTAAGLLAAVVQQGLTRPDRLLETLALAGQVRHRRLMTGVLADIAGGAQALSEIDVARLCRRGGLPEPTRQRVRRDVNGRRRYLDCEWELPGGRVVGLEIDGIGHMEATRWYDDLLRQAELDVSSSHVLLRLPALAARVEPDRVLAVLRRALFRP